MFSENFEAHTKIEKSRKRVDSDCCYCSGLFQVKHRYRSSKTIHYKMIKFGQVKLLYMLFAHNLPGCFTSRKTFSTNEQCKSGVLTARIITV